MLGTYSVRMTEGGHPSEQVTGVGLGSEEVPNAWTNTAFRFTFELVKGSKDDVVVLPPEEPPTEPGPTEPVVPPLHQALLKAAQTYLSARSPKGYFDEYAQARGLGNRLTGDFTVEYSGVRYTAQVFQKGIVYAPVGEWDQVTHAVYES
jgi:hypothetical protein